MNTVTDSRAEPVLPKLGEAPPKNSKLTKTNFIILSIFLVIGVAIAYQYVCITPKEVAMAKLNIKPKNIVEEMQTES